MDPAALPSQGAVFLDSRGGDRAMRTSWHWDAGVVVISLWRGNLCTGSFRLPAEDVPSLVEALCTGLNRGYAEPEAG